jgi:hypothetical protein
MNKFTRRLRKFYYWLAFTLATLNVKGKEVIPNVDYIIAQANKQYKPKGRKRFHLWVRLLAWRALEGRQQFPSGKFIKWGYVADETFGWLWYIMRFVLYLTMLTFLVEFTLKALDTPLPGIQVVGNIFAFALSLTITDVITHQLYSDPGPRDLLWRVILLDNPLAAQQCLSRLRTRLDEDAHPSEPTTGDGLATTQTLPVAKVAATVGSESKVQL